MDNDRHFSCGIQRVIPNGQDKTHLPGWEASHNTGFGSSFCYSTFTLVFSFAAAQWKSQYQNQNTGNATPKPSQTYAVLSAIQQSPSNQPSPLSAQNQSKSANATPASRSASHRPKERMHHNIPHRYGTVKRLVDAAMNRF